MVARLPITVRYAETDAMGVVHHASYIVWLEASRVEWMDQIGFPYTQVEALGIGFAVIEVNFIYRAAAKFGDKVEVEVWLAELSSRILKYQYRVWKAQALLGEGFTRHIAQDKTGKAVRIPPEVLGVLQKGLAVSG